MMQVNPSSIGYMVAFQTATNNTSGVNLNNARGSVTQALAQWFSGAPSVADIEVECANIAAGYTAAAEKGHKVGKTAAGVMQAQFRKIGAACRGEVKHGLTDSPVVVTFAKADDDTIIGFGHGSISKEYAFILQAEKTAIELIAAIDSGLRDAAKEYADYVAEQNRRRVELMAQVK